VQTDDPGKLFVANQSFVLPQVFAAPAGLPRFANYAAPAGLGDGAGEPSIGINWNSEKTFSNSMFSIANGGTSMYFGGFLSYALKVTFDDCPSPALAIWEKKSVTLPSTPRAFGDPILFTDHETGRTFVSQLEGLTPLGSTTEFTDNDGDSFLPSQGSGIATGVDHQTFGGGPFHAPLTGGTSVYKNATYYCSQSIADASCALSLDGGVTFSAQVPIFTIADCDGLHGHIKVGPDGTAYVPDKGCGGPAPLVLGNEQASVVVSENNGATWAIRPILSSTYGNAALTKGDDDPSVGVASDGTIYLGYQSLDGHPRIAASHDKGVTWSSPYDVGAQVVNGGAVLNTAFPAVVAGDSNRAAFAFYGSETGGDNYKCGQGDDCSDDLGNNPQPAFTGTWYLYIATTFDGGQTWTTQNLTPGDPVQRGGICNNGDCRNQLDFFDAAIDKEGRLVVGWDDGCVGPCVQAPPNSFTAKATITRQSGGQRMFAAFDPVGPVLPGAPKGTGIINEAGTQIDLSWPSPDDGGSTITAYKIYRAVGSSGSFSLIATVNSASFDDTTFQAPATNNLYRITAVNSQGEGPYCAAITPVQGSTETSCLQPGLTKLTDDAGDTSAALGVVTTPAPPGSDLLSFQIAQPYAADGIPRLVFTINTDAGESPQPPGSAWYVAMKIINGTTTTYKGVHMAWTGTSPTFESYTPGANTSGGVDGRFVTTGSQEPAEPESTYAAPFNKVVIVVKASDLGLNPGDSIAGFVSGVSQSTDPGATIGRGATALYDEMPDGLGFTGSFTVTDNALCANVNPPPTPTPTPTPGPKTIGTSGPVSPWDGTWTGALVSPGGVIEEDTCVDGVNCETFTFTVGGTKDDWIAANKRVQVRLNWQNSSNEYDIYIHQGSDTSGPLVTSSIQGPGLTHQVAFIDVAQVGTGVFTVHVAYDVTATSAADPYLGVVSAVPETFPTAPAASQDTGPKVGYENFEAPGVLTPVITTSAGQQVNSVEYMGRGAGEPSIGNNWKSGVTNFQSDLQTLFITFNNTTHTATWVNRAAPTSQAVDSDPIGFTDPQTGRTFAGELTLLSPDTCKTSYSDDDGQTWIPSQGSGIASGVDHETIGGGPFHAPLTRPTGVPGLYPNAVYYCSQDIATAFCSRSDDGGLTFGASVPLYTLTECVGIHGHVKVAPDGTVYVPNNNCNSGGAVVVSQDNGTTWNVKSVRNSGWITSSGSADPAVAVDASGRVYFAIANNDNSIAVGTSDNQGQTWNNIVDVGGSFGLNNIRFPAAIAGDAGRAAVAFYGSTTVGDANSGSFNGVWHLYIAHTFDGGLTWTTSDATPNAPMQRGNIWTNGGANIGRNLLDFFDMTVDKEGRVLVGYVNGCAGGNCAQSGSTASGNAYTATATIARQSSGRRLFARFDPATATSVPGMPSVTTRRVGNVVHLGWSEADTGNSAVTSYKILRGTASGAETLLTSVPGTQTLYDDATATDTTRTYYYKVLAVNAVGTSYAGNEVSAPYVGDTCTGLIIHKNEPTHPEASAGTATPASLLIDYVAVGEPPRTNNFLFKMKVNDLSSVPPNSRWRITWNSFSSPGQQYYVGMTTGASGPPTFEYGTLKDAGVPAVFVIRETKGGDALAGSNFSADGTITIFVPKAALGNPQSGDLLGAIGGRTLTADTPATNTLERSNVFVDHTFVKAQTDNSYPAATYTVVGDAANRPPLAVLTATPTSGFAPLTVNFSGAGSSDPDSCDSVVSYTFDFGDGTAPVTQTGSTISHTYNAAGTYNAKLSVTDSFGAQNTNVASVTIQVSAPPPPCIEDNDARIAYSNGWHLINYASASDGHFRYHSGNSPQHFANLDFTVPTGSTGSITYSFAKSPKGGTADIYLDGVFKQTVNYAGSVGSTQAPEFKPEYQVQFGNLSAGAHKLEIKNLTGVVYVDRFCLQNSVSNAQPAAGPGNTSNQSSNVSAGQTSSSNYQMQSGSQEISVVAESSLNVPFKLALVNPSGLALQTVDASNGTAVLNASVTQSGVYMIKVVNVSLGPLQFNVTATPLVSR